MAHENSSQSAASSLKPISTSETSHLPQKDSRAEERARKWPKSVVYQLLVTAFLVSPSFGVTQVPLIYVFGVMTCNEYYRHHDLPHLERSAYEDRCEAHAIEASTARAVTLLGAGSTFFGVANLFFIR
jgi:hypothetical protein